MYIEWTFGIERPNELRGLSNSWTDHGDPLPYVLKFCPSLDNWGVTFEDSLVCRGTLQQCIAACEAADRDGVFEAHPDMGALARESADKHSNFGIE